MAVTRIAWTPSLALRLSQIAVEIPRTRAICAQTCNVEDQGCKQHAAVSRQAADRTLAGQERQAHKVKNGQATLRKDIEK